MAILAIVNVLISSIENRTPTEIALFEVFQRYDVLNMIWEPEPQCGEYLGDAEKFIKWLKEAPEPDFEGVEAKLHAIYDDFDLFYNPSEKSLLDLAGALCSIIYDQPS